jgi:hypothetical protein
MIAFARDADNTEVLLDLEDLMARIYMQTGEWPEFEVEIEDLAEIEVGA